jgi:DNA mismatch endonuclease (patch repair protein)
MRKIQRSPRVTSYPKAPSFASLRPASDASSRAMKRNLSRNTQPEILLRTALRAYGLRYRLHFAALPGRPDLVFPSKRLAIFCDGDFWHGRYWPRLRKQLAQRANADYWIAKIAANRARDRFRTRQLTESGWTVLRFWETDIRRNAQIPARRIATKLGVARVKVTERQRARPSSWPHSIRD